MSSIIQPKKVSHPSNSGEKRTIYEPILDEKNRTFTVPIPANYPIIWKFYKKMAACFWVPEEVDFSNDYEDFITLNDNEQYFVKMVLAFFAGSDGIVNFNLEERFLKEIQIMEAKCAYGFQEMMENQHSEMYALMLDNIIRDNTEREKLFNAIKTIPSVKKMAEWQFKWIESDTSFAERVIAFGCVETIFFSGMFAAIFWLKKYKGHCHEKGRPFMNGLISSNKFIARDEGLHGFLSAAIFQELKHKPDKERVYEIVDSAVQNAKHFMMESIPVRLIGMNSEQMCNYIEHVADILLQMYSYPEFYKKENPFDFMNSIGMHNKTNFFELRATEYSKSHSFNENVVKDKVVVDFENF